MELPRPILTKGEKTKLRILDASLALFAQKGYKATTVRDIAARVGIKQSALYNHYRNKEDILDNIIEHISQSDPFNIIKDEDDSLKGKGFLSTIARRMKLLSFDTTNDKHTLFIMQELYRNDKVRFLYQEHFYHRNIKTLSGHFFAMMQHDIIRSCDPLFAAHSFLSPLFFYHMQIMILKVDKRSTSSWSAHFEKHVDFFWDGIRHPSDTKQTLF